MRGSATWLVVLAGCGVNPAFDMTTTGAAGESSTGTPPSPTTGPASSSSDASTASDASTGSVEPASTSSTSSTTTTTATSDETTSGTTGPNVKDMACPDLDALVACYTFPEDAGDSLIDGSGNMLDGDKKFTNPAASVPGYGSGVEFIEQSDVFAKPSAKFTTKYFTVTTFAFVKQGGMGKALIDKQFHYALFAADGEAICVVRSTGGMKTVKRPIPVEQWIHLSCTFDGAEVRLRVYGPGAPTEPGVAPLAGILDPDVDSELRLGFDPPTLSTKFNGKLDHVLVFSEALGDDTLCALASPLCP